MSDTDNGMNASLSTSPTGDLQPDLAGEISLHAGYYHRIRFDNQTIAGVLVNDSGSKLVLVIHDNPGARRLGENFLTSLSIWASRGLCNVVYADGEIDITFSDFRDGLTIKDIASLLEQNQMVDELEAECIAAAIGLVTQP